MDAMRHPPAGAAVRKAFSVGGCGFSFGGRQPSSARQRSPASIEQTVDENQKAIGTKKQ
jgi:hypothetical protein